MHTKKTNNTNKLMQISYRFGLTKIQKLQNLKKKKKKLFFGIGRYCPKLAGMIDTAGTSTVLTTLVNGEQLKDKYQPRGISIIVQC